MPEAPLDNLVRAYSEPAEYRADENNEVGTMFGHFAVFNRWTEIDSLFEGRFLERIAPGTFARSFDERADQIRVLYDHGHDPAIGNKPLGAPDVLREDKNGAYYEVSLFDASYVNDLKPALRAGQLGASFRFRVTGEDWSEPPKASKDNPQKLPERTINDVDLYEFGPVTFPAYADASAGMRSRTDEFIEWLMNEPRFAAQLHERMGAKVMRQTLEAIPRSLGNNIVIGDALVEPSPTPTEVPAVGRSEVSDRRAWIARHLF